MNKLEHFLLPVISLLCKNNCAIFYHYCVFSQQDNRHVRGLLHWWAAVLFSIRPDWLLQLCVLPAKRRETAIARGAPRGETDSMAQSVQ